MMYPALVKMHIHSWMANYIASYSVIATFMEVINDDTH